MFFSVVVLRQEMEALHQEWSPTSALLALFAIAKFEDEVTNRA